MDEGDIPPAGDHYAGIGGAVGIHGTDKPSLNARNADGCIALEDADVAELVTLVLIEDCQGAGSGGPPKPDTSAASTLPPLACLHRDTTRAGALGFRQV
jgi:hypothetical protein